MTLAVDMLSSQVTKKSFNEASFEQIPKGSQILSHKYSGTVWAKRIGKIYIFSLCWNSEIIPLIFLSGTDQGFINSFPSLPTLFSIWSIEKTNELSFLHFSHSLLPF